MKKRFAARKCVIGAVLSRDRGRLRQKRDYDLDTAKILHTAPTNASASAGVPIVMRK
jgi:hypothetical protein